MPPPDTPVPFTREEARAIATEVGQLLSTSMTQTMQSSIATLSTKVEVLDVNVCHIRKRLDEIGTRRCPAHEAVVLKVAANEEGVERAEKERKGMQMSARDSFSRTLSLISLFIVIVLFIITLIGMALRSNVAAPVQ